MLGGSFYSGRRQLLAWGLLLLLVRVLAPEAAVLRLHAHAHTVAEPAFAKSAQPKGTLLTAKHQHCHAEQLYQLPFEPAMLLRLPTPNWQRIYAAYRPLALVDRAAHLLAGACLRGPPIVAHTLRGY